MNVYGVNPNLDNIEGDKCYKNLDELRGKVDGIVNVVSKNRDFAGIDLPRSGIFINYDFFSPEKVCDCKPRSPDLPDSRNILYWNGDLHVEECPLGEISFRTGDSTGDYAIVLQGILQNGDVFVQKLNFRVE